MSLDKKGHVWAAQNWTSNAELIADVAHLGYLPPERVAYASVPEDDHALVIDLTYGFGTWWHLYRPWNLITNDLDPESMAENHEDFRSTHWDDGLFDYVAFDPPYVCVGGRKTSTIKEHHARYGMASTPKRPQDLAKLIFEGMSEAARILKPGGILIVKSMPYISNGQYQDGLGNVLFGAEIVLDLDLIDRFIHVGQPGRQSQKTQVHSRNNYSVLQVFRKPGKLAPKERKKDAVQDTDQL